MSGTKVRAPAALLLHRDLTASAKLLWLVGRLCPGAGPTQLGAQSGLSQPTVRKGLAHLATKTPHGPAPPGTGARTAALPNDLLTDRSLSALARVLFGALQLLPDFHDQRGRFTYANLSDLTGLDPRPVKRAVHELARTGWLQISQRNQAAPVSFALSHPDQARLEAAVARATQHITVASNTGEAIMKEYLSLLVASDQFEENATPGFLVNPYTQERMELDRYYPPGVAFEYNGAQHDGPTERFPDSDQAARQRGRDLMKLGICQELSIQLVIIRRADLSLRGMQAKVGRLLPLRDLQNHGPLIDYLERRSRRYRRGDDFTSTRYPQPSTSPLPPRSVLGG